MRVYLYAAVALALLAVIAYPVLSYLIEKPERPRLRARGSHHRLRWWQRIRDRRLEERAQDALNLRLLQDISNGLRGEVTRATTPRAERPLRMDHLCTGRACGQGPMPHEHMPEWPLQPLPPGAEEHADHFHRPVAEGTSFGAESYTPAPETQVPLEAERSPEDPVDVATPGQVADAYVGEYAREGAGEMVPKSVGSLLGTPEPVGLAGQPGEDGSEGAGLTGPPPAGSLPSPAPEPAPLTDFREETGSWSALVDAVMPKDGA